MRQRLGAPPPLRHSGFATRSWTQTKGRHVPRRTAASRPPVGSLRHPRGLGLWTTEETKLRGQPLGMDNPGAWCWLLPCPRRLSLLWEDETPHLGLLDQGSFQQDRESRGPLPALFPMDRYHSKQPQAPCGPGRLRWSTSRGRAAGRGGPRPQGSPHPTSELFSHLPARPVLTIETERGDPDGIISCLTGNFLSLGFADHAILAQLWAAVVNRSLLLV